MSLIAAAQAMTNKAARAVAAGSSLARGRQRAIKATTESQENRVDVDNAVVRSAYARGVVLLTGVGLAVRVLWLNHEPIWRDEAFTAVVDLRGGRAAGALHRVLRAACDSRTACRHALGAALALADCGHGGGSFGTGVCRVGPVARVRGAPVQACRDPFLGAAVERDKRERHARPVPVRTRDRTGHRGQACDSSHPAAGSDRRIGLRVPYLPGSPAA